MIESKIIEALQKQAIKTINDNKHVKCLNVNYNPPSNKRWWEIIYLPNNYENEYWDKGKTYRGIFRLILHWPQKNEGIYKPMEEVERVAKGFEKGTILTDDMNNVKVQISDNPDVTSIIEEESGLLIGLTIKYLCSTL